MISLKTEKPVLCLGDVNPDLILPYGQARAVLDAVAEGKKVEKNKEGAHVECGGSIGNTTSNLAKLGVDTWFAGKVGQDAFGRFLKNDFEKDGVNTKYMIEDPDSFTCIVSAVIGLDSERVVFVWPRSNAAHMQLRPEDLPDSLIDEIGWVHSSGIMLREQPAAETIVSFLEKCASKGVIVSFDLNLRFESAGIDENFRKLIDRVIKASNVLLGNGVEEFMPLTGAVDPEAAAKMLVSDKRAVVIRGGKIGAFLYTDTDRFESKAYAVKVVDKVGAGDSFDSGFIAAAVRGLPLQDTIVWGNAVACYTLQFKGARTGPTYEKLMQFLKDFEGKYES